MSGWRGRRHPGLFWSGVLLALVALVGGGVYAYLGYSETSGPDGAVRGYFAALARSDAATALGYGDLPAGPHTLLTATVLKEQQHIAKIHDVKVLSVDTTGGTSAVDVDYQLGFATGNQQVNDVITVHRRDGAWRLAQTAVATTLNLKQADRRASIVGAAVPAGDTLLFPGAVPIAFDTSYLQLSNTTDSVRLGNASVTDLLVQVSPAGRTALDAKLSTLLSACAKGGSTADLRCPLPSDRYVPGSLSGTVSGNLADDLQYGLDNDSDGVIAVSGDVKFTGSYRRLNFDNVAAAGHGTLSLSVSATAFAVTPLVVTFGGAP